MWAPGFLFHRKIQETPLEQPPLWRILPGWRLYCIPLRKHKTGRCVLPKIDLCNGDDSARPIPRRFQMESAFSDSQRRFDLIHHFQKVRSLSIQICEPLQTEDYIVQSMPDVS